MIGAWLAPSLKGSDGVKTVAVGAAAGVLALPIGGLLASLGGFAEALIAGRVGVADIPAVAGGFVVNPIPFTFFGAPALLVLVPTGVVWAVLTSRLGWRADSSVSPRTLVG